MREPHRRKPAASYFSRKMPSRRVTSSYVIQYRGGGSPHAARYAWWV
ncbi:hypothetical protein ACIPPJ_32815 [Streptomyces sp. NPDC086091]